MRGKRAKALRRIVWPDGNFRQREYVEVNRRKFYGTGELRNTFSQRLRKAWGHWFETYTRRADPQRWWYQHLKKMKPTGNLFVTLQRRSKVTAAQASLTST